ncbi:MAG: PAS domain S-box protein, partial [Anaerolineae bacterium]|nr:PAS domain S-box protein [Anaerolineae bacterium]
KSYLDGELPSYAVEKRYIRKDGAIRWVRTMGDIMWVAADQPPLAIANVVDITAHRQMEETLRESEDQYRLLAETTRDIILLHDMEGRITYVNRAGLHFGGFSEAEALGKPITAFMPPDRLAEIAERRARRAASDDTTFLYETEFVDNAGRRVPVEVNSTPALRGGKPAQMLIVARDITARKQAENALRAERDLVSRIIETSPACITMVNRAGQIVFANPQAEPVLGLSRDVIHQRTYNDPEWRITAYNGGPFPEDELPFAQAQRTLRPVNDVRHAIEWPDGRRVLLRINAAPMLDESGAFNGIISSIEDVTERVQAQEALQASEQRYRALFEQMTEGFALHEIILDEDEQPCDYRFLHVNRAFEQLTGLQAEDLVGRTVLEALPDTEPYWIETYGQVALTGQPLHFENYSGALGKYYDVTAYSPEPGRFATVFTDITERKRVENELQRRVAQLALLNDIGEQVAAVLELDKVFERAVDLVHESFGYHHVSIFTLEQEHLTIRAKAGSLAHLLPAGHRLKLGQGIVGWVGMHGETLLANDVAIEPRYVNFYGDVIPTRAELSVPICIGGEVVGVLDAQSPQRNAFDDSDVMVMKTLADQVAVAIQNARLYEKQERYGVRLQSSNQELEQFAYVASHDLQEPLRAISGYLELLERRYGDQLDERGQRFIAYAVDGAARMHELIRSLLDYSRIGAQGWQPGRVDGEAVFVQVLAGLTKAIQENNAVITHDPLPVVTGDPIQLRRVLQNLVGNAIKFHDSEPPRVHVAVERAEDEWRFSVRDNGIGIAPEQIGRLFAIFQRLHTREEYPGAGIGLAICKKIVERHGGRIWVESAPGRGATFYFTLPTGETDR